MNRTTQTDIGMTLKIARITRRLLQRDVARRARISPPLLSLIENGVVLPTDQQIAKIRAAIERGQANREVRDGSEPPQAA